MFSHCRCEFFWEYFNDRGNESSTLAFSIRFLLLQSKPISYDFHHKNRDRDGEVVTWRGVGEWPLNGMSFFTYGA